MHARTAASTAVAVFIASVALGTPRRGVLLMLGLLPLFWVGALWIRDVMLEIRMAAVHPGFVNTDFELTGPGDRSAAASMLVLVQGVEAVAVIGPGSTGGSDQRVDYHDQQDQDARGQDACTGNTGLHLKYQEHIDGHSCRWKGGRENKRETKGTEIQINSIYYILAYKQPFIQDLFFSSLDNCVKMTL